MDIRMSESLEKMESLKWKIEESAVALDLATSGGEGDEVGKVACLVARELCRVFKDLEIEIDKMQKIIREDWNEGQKE